VVRNVLDNADRYAISVVTIKVHNAETRAILTIDDDGPPVPAPDRERIFERFVRLDESRSREQGGSGLGLAIAAAVMAAHNGSIRTSEAPGGGCRFEMVFPHNAPAAAPAAETGVGTGAGTGAGTKIAGTKSPGKKVSR
jgi:signal transduction histidine kinase